MNIIRKGPIRWLPQALPAAALFLEAVFLIEVREVFCEAASPAFFAAQRLFSASTMRFLPAALSLRFFRVVVASVGALVASASTLRGGRPGPRLPIIERTDEIWSVTRISLTSSPISAASRIVGSSEVIALSHIRNMSENLMCATCIARHGQLVPLNRVVVAPDAG